MVGADLILVEGEVALHHAGAKGHGGHAGGQAALVPGVAHGKIVALAQRVHDRQADLLLVAGVRAVAMQKHQVVVPGADDLHRPVDLLQAAHARAHDDRQAALGDLPHQGHVDHIGGADLDELKAKAQHLRQAHFVPGGNEEHQPKGFGQKLQLGHFLGGKFQRHAVFAVGGAEAVGAGVGGLAPGAGQKRLHVPFLKLHGLDARLGGFLDHAAGLGHVALVVVANLGHNEARLPLADLAAGWERNGGDVRHAHNLTVSSPLRVETGCSC